jgi:hypothetical protein
LFLPAPPPSRSPKENPKFPSAAIAGEEKEEKPRRRRRSQ